MLPKQLLMTGCAWLAVIAGLAQKHITERNSTTSVSAISSQSIEQLPFTRNFNEFAIRQNFAYNRVNEDNSDNHTSNVSLDIDYNRFVIDHLAVGVDLSLSSSKSESANSSATNSNWMAYANVMYGTTFNNNFNLYGKLSVGVGNDKFKYPTNTEKEDLFGYRLEIGSPVHLFDGGGNFITPFIAYDVLERKDGGAKYTDDKFLFGFRFQNYSPCNAYSCDCHHGRSFSRGIYDQGRSFIGYSSMGDFGFGKSKYEFGNVNSDDDVSGGLFNLEYSYYFIPNLAIGAGVNWDGQTTKSGGTKYTSSQLVLMPMLTANLPSDDCWNNLFLQGGYGFGYEKTTSGSNDLKYNISNYCFNLGFNDFIGKHIAFTPKIGYDWEAFKNTKTDVKTKYSGFEFSLGGSLHF